MKTQLKLEDELLHPICTMGVITNLFPNPTESLSGKEAQGKNMYHLQIYF